MANVDLVPIKEACQLWKRDKRTLMSWAESGQLLYDKLCGKGKKGAEKVFWYIETPSARQKRIFNN